MKKGFTLIELLAVIVILAIIALIATPIVLSIIEDSKSNANLRSAENYLTAAKQSITNHQMNNPDQSVSGVYKVMKNGNLCKGTIDNDKCNGIEIRVQVSGEKIMPSEITIGDTGDLTNVEGLEINGKNYAYTNGSLKETTPSVICIANTSKVSALVFNSGSFSEESSYISQEVGLLASESGAYTQGVTYACELGDGETNVFYVLEENGDNVSLIASFVLDNNCVLWDGSCILKNIEEKLKNSTANWIKLQESQITLPSANQIATAYGKTFDPGSASSISGLPTWLVSYTKAPLSNGYWTSTSNISDSNKNWLVLSTTNTLESQYTSAYGNVGIRPVITISKSQLD